MARTVGSQIWLTMLMALGLAATVIIARPASAQSDPGTSPWSAPAPIATGLTEAARPALIFTSGGTEHAAWESAGQIFYATQPISQSWSAPHRVATGISPTILADGLGQLHIVYANQFMGNYEIYASSFADGIWSLPVNVSHTTGFSAYPVATSGENGDLYVAWMDNSPGYWTIYVGIWNGTYWSNKPVPNARGQAPALAFADDGTLFLAWQDRVPAADNLTGAFDIFLSERSGTAWTLPVNISDRPAVDSIGVDLTTARDGFAHLTWVDGDQEVRYCFGEGSYWPYPVTVARAASTARGPQILTEKGMRLYIAWDEGDMIRATSAAPRAAIWPKPAIVTAPMDDLSDVALSPGTSNGVSVGWVQTNQPGDVGVYESWRASDLIDRGWLPMILR